MDFKQLFQFLLLLDIGQAGGQKIIIGNMYHFRPGLFIGLENVQIGEISLPRVNEMIVVKHSMGREMAIFGNVFYCHVILGL